MNKQTLSLALMALAMMSLALLVACGSSGEDIKDAGSPWDENPHELGTPACDRFCARNYDENTLDFYVALADCADACPTEDCITDKCEPKYDDCVDEQDGWLEDCADDCEGCLADGVDCLDGCGANATQCRETCFGTIYTCNDWDFACWGQCTFTYENCVESALNNQTAVACAEKYLECKRPCRE
jgi:hypothetical protein